MGASDRCEWAGMGVKALLELIWMALGGREGLGRVKRVWDWGGGIRVGVKGQGIVWRPRMGMEGLIWV